MKGDGLIKSRLVELDIFKGVCILAVLAIHMSGIIAKGGQITGELVADYYFFSIITRFCVPSFILITGVL